MKKLILILAFLPFLGFSQGIDLELNQVLLVSEGSMVPEGKVWKITSTLVNCSYNCYAYIWIGENVVYVHFNQEISSTSTSPTHNPTQFPIWVPAGINIDIGENVSGISVLEFNTVSE